MGVGHVEQGLSDFDGVASACAAHGAVASLVVVVFNLEAVLFFFDHTPTCIEFTFEIIGRVAKFNQLARLKRTTV